MLSSLIETGEVSFPDYLASVDYLRECGFSSTTSSDRVWEKPETKESAVLGYQPTEESYLIIFFAEAENGIG